MEKNSKHIKRKNTTSMNYFNKEFHSYFSNKLLSVLSCENNLQEVAFDGFLLTNTINRN
jgi:hypothetical protein